MDSSVVTEGMNEIIKIQEKWYPNAYVVMDSNFINGIKIYNATRGGKLEVFERVDFDSLF